MKKLSMALVLSLVAVGAWSQQVTATVITGNTDPVQIQRWIAEAASEAQRLQQLVEQVRSMNEMVQAQYAVIEELSRGDWESILDAYQLQSQALYEFDNVLLNMDETFVNLNMDELAEAESLADMQATVSGFTDAYASTTDTLREARGLARNAIWRAERMAELQGMSAADPGLARQLQIENAQLALVSGQLGEMQYTLSSLAAVEEVKMLEEEAAVELSRQGHEDFWTNNLNDALYERSYTDQEFDQTIMGGSFMDRGMQ